jgi:hypothetical protein
MRTPDDNPSVRRRNAHKQGSSRCDQQGCNMVHLLQQAALCCTARASKQRCPSSVRRGAPGSSGVCACVCARRTPQHGIAARSRWRCRALRGPPAQGTRSAVFTVKAAPPPRRSYDATCSGRAGHHATWNVQHAEQRPACDVEVNARQRAHAACVQCTGEATMHERPARRTPYRL